MTAKTQNSGLHPTYWIVGTLVTVGFAAMIASCAESQSLLNVPDGDTKDEIASLAASHPALTLDDSGQLMVREDAALSPDDEVFVTAAVLYANRPADDSGSSESAEDETGKPETSGEKIRSVSASGESDLDVFVTFSGDDWKRVQKDARRGDARWAANRVIGEFKKYHLNPDKYFASLPKTATRGLSFRTRIEIEIIGHVVRGDREMHFSQWWITKGIWD